MSMNEQGPEESFFDQIRNEAKEKRKNPVTSTELDERFDRQNAEGIGANWDHIRRQSDCQGGKQDL